MMGTTASGFGELLPISKLGIERICLLLRTLILPVGGPFVGQSCRKLISETFLCVQTAENLLSIGVPEDTAMLLTRARNTFDAVQRDGHGFGKAGKDEI